MCRRIGDLVDGSSSLDFIRNLTSLNVLYATFFFSVEHTVLYLFFSETYSIISWQCGEVLNYESNTFLQSIEELQDI
jgi:hypothetical protein